MSNTAKVYDFSAAQERRSSRMENQKQGHFALFRSLLSKEWASDTAKFSLWVRIIGQAQYKPRTVEFDGVKWNLQAGQLVTKVPYLAKKLKDSQGNEKSPKQVRDMLEFFAKENMITFEGNRHGTVITVTNYADYQADFEVTNEVTKEVTNKPSTGAAFRGVEVTNEVTKEVKQSKKLLEQEIINNKNTMSEQVRTECKKSPALHEETDRAFEEIFWLAGMVKGGKAKAKSAFRTQFKAWRKESGGTPEQFAQFLADDIASRKGKQFGFDKLHPSTYLNGQRWNDEKPVPEPTQSNNSKFSIGSNGLVFY
ncbi:replication protein [Hafnia paralvei]|uniref:replication protein n=1 Tax=Hafnia paralvei TaxID=546367 RepID=UPI00266D0A0C|nr:replication protein [Hafnia paralvei]